MTVGDRPQGVAGDCNSLAETHAWFDSRVAHHFTTALICLILFEYNSLLGVYFDTKLKAFGTMKAKTVKYLKEDRGPFFYRRRVPKQYHKTLGVTVWTKPCGDVSFAKTVSLVTEWADEHDALLATLQDPI